MCGAVVLATLALVVFPRLRAFLPLDHSRRTYAIGSHVDVPSSLYDGANHTLLVFVRASCAACQDAKPVLSRLIAELAGFDIQVRVLAPAETREQQGPYIASLGLHPAAFVPTQFRDTRLRVVPTTLLVDHRGVILQATEGTRELEEFRTAALAQVGGR